MTPLFSIPHKRGPRQPLHPEHSTELLPWRHPADFHYVHSVGTYVR